MPHARKIVWFSMARSPAKKSRHSAKMIVPHGEPDALFVLGARCFVSDTRSDDITSSLPINQFIHTCRTRFCGQKNCAHVCHVSYVFTCLTYKISAAKTWAHASRAEIRHYYSVRVHAAHGVTKCNAPYRTLPHSTRRRVQLLIDS